VPDIAASSTDPRSSSSASCWEKYAGTTPRPRRGVALAEQRLEERRLAGAVRPDERDMLAPLDRERRLVEQRFVTGADPQPLCDCDVTARPGGLEELEAECPPPAVGRVHTLRLQALDLLQLRLRLPCLRRLVAEPLDEPLEPGELLGLPLRRLRLVQVPRRLLATPDVPGAGEVDGPAAIELEHRGRHRLEEPAVVRDEHHAGVDRLQHLLEPFERLDVEVVRRFVEQQQVRLRGERSCERGAGQLAARKRAQRALEVVVGEAEAAHDGRRPVAPVVAAGVLEPRLRLRVAPKRRRVVLARRHPFLERPQHALDGGKVGGAREHVLA
jgi:hypothetical protein